MMLEERDDFDHALAEAVRQGRVIKTTDDEGRTVYKKAESN